MILPEGLYATPDPDAPENVEIRDAQDILWVTLHQRAIGDPLEWELNIRDAVLQALNITEVTR